MPEFFTDREIGSRAGRTLTGESERFGRRPLSAMPQMLTGKKGARGMEVRMTTRMRVVLALRRASKES